MHPRLCLQILRYAQDDKERNASFCGAESVILRAKKRRFLKPHGVKVQHWYSRCQALLEYFFKINFLRKVVNHSKKTNQLMQQAKSTDSVRKIVNKVSKVSIVSNFCVGVQNVNFKLIYIIYIIYIKFNLHTIG